MIRDKRGTLALWEIASVVTSGLIAQWIVLSFVGSAKVVLAIPILCAVAFVIFSQRERGETLRDIGFRMDTFLAACRLLALPTVAAIIVIAFVSWLVNGAIITAPWRNRFLTLPLWALFQQYMLNGFINRRAQIATGKGPTSVLLVGVAFGILHLPNLLLAFLTLIGGVIWAAVYQRQPNLFALALSQAIISLFLALTLSASLLNSLRVGFKYFGFAY